MLSRLLLAACSTRAHAGFPSFRWLSWRVHEGGLGEACEPPACDCTEVPRFFENLSSSSSSSSSSRGFATSVVAVNSVSRGSAIATSELESGRHETPEQGFGDVGEMPSVGNDAMEDLIKSFQAEREEILASKTRSASQLQLIAFSWAAKTLPPDSRENFSEGLPTVSYSSLIGSSCASRVWACTSPLLHSLVER